MAIFTASTRHTRSSFSVATLARMASATPTRAGCHHPRAAAAPTAPPCPRRTSASTSPSAGRALDDRSTSPCAPLPSSRGEGSALSRSCDPTDDALTSQLVPSACSIFTARNHASRTYSSDHFFHSFHFFHFFTTTFLLFTLFFLRGQQRPRAAGHARGRHGGTRSRTPACAACANCGA